MHGGKAPQVQAAAARRLQLLQAHEEVKSLGLRVDVTPEEALLEALQTRTADLRYLADRTAELVDPVVEELGAGGSLKLTAHPYTTLKRDTTRDVAQIAQASLNLDIAGRVAAVNEAELRLTAAPFKVALLGILEDLGHSLQDPRVVEVVRRRLEAALTPSEPTL